MWCLKITVSKDLIGWRGTRFSSSFGVVPHGNCCGKWTWDSGNQTKITVTQNELQFIYGNMNYDLKYQINVSLNNFDSFSKTLNCWRTLMDWTQVQRQLIKCFLSTSLNFVNKCWIWWLQHISMKLVEEQKVVVGILPQVNRWECRDWVRWSIVHSKYCLEQILCRGASANSSCLSGLISLVNWHVCH